MDNKLDGGYSEKQKAKDKAFEALHAAERAMHKYASECEVGREREKAFRCFENIRRSWVDA